MANSKKMVTKQEARSMANALRDRGISSIAELAGCDAKKLSRWTKIPQTVAKRLISTAKKEDESLLDIDLTVLPGVGQARKEALEEAGIVSVKDLARSKVSEVEELLGMLPEEIQVLIGTACRVHALAMRIQGKTPPQKKRLQPSQAKKKSSGNQESSGNQAPTAENDPMAQIRGELTRRLVAGEGGNLARDIAGAMGDAFKQCAEFRRKLISRVMADPSSRAQVVRGVIKNIV